MRCNCRARDHLPRFCRRPQAPPEPNRVTCESWHDLTELGPNTVVGACRPSTLAVNIVRSLRSSSAVAIRPGPRLVHIGPSPGSEGNESRAARHREACVSHAQKSGGFHGSNPLTAQASPDTPLGAAPAATRTIKRTLGAYVALTKPRIIETLLVTTIPTMFLAAGGFPSWWLVVATLVGGTLAAGGANTLNCVYDRDIDATMDRTKRRPLVTGEVGVRSALIFGLALSTLSFVWLWAFVNLVSAALGVAAILFYVVVYTMILKRRTSQNIVWGGAAGCMPVLIGWSAVTGSLSWAALALFLVIFFWTPPHYWPLAMRFRDDYDRAGVPMLPVVTTAKNVSNQMIWHTVAMIAASLSLVWLGPTGWVYGIAAVVFGGGFFYMVLRFALRVRRGVTGKALNSMSVFHASLSYLTLLFVALAIDPFIR
ncbi:protoheme IX farnesyltransferase [Micrococcales bacterium 31B]|nr:protoheme IX farnesyltransferase [Micrococcales bacterium 31B]